MRTIRPLLLLFAIAMSDRGLRRRLVRRARPGRRSPTTAQPAAGEAGGKDLSGGGAQGAPPANPEPQPGLGGGEIAAVDDAKIIRTGTMSLEVSDVGNALRVARDAIVGLGGYVGASTTSNDGEQPSPRSRTASRQTSGRRRSTASAVSTA